MLPNDNLQRIRHTDQLILDEHGNLVGVKNPKGQGMDLRPLQGVFDSEGTPVGAYDPLTGDTIALGGGTARAQNAAGRCAIPNRLHASTALMTRSYHYAGADMRSYKCEFPNFYVSGFGNSSVDGEEKGPGAAATIRATIEYPIGTVAGRFLFSGSDTGSIPDLAVLVSDVLTGISIPRGAFFRISAYRTCSGGCVYTSNTPYGSLSFDETDTSAATDQTGDVTNVGAANGSFYAPSAIICDTTVESVYLGVGDSLVLGTDVDQGLDSLGAYGIFARALAIKFIPYCNGGVGSQQAQFYKTSNTLQTATMQWHSRVFGNLGTNDVQASRTPTQIIADLNTIYSAIAAAHPTLKLFHSTMQPRMNTSTNYFTTTSGQSHSTPTYPPKLETVNNRLTTGAVTALHGVIDIGKVNVSAPGSQKWAVHPRARVIADATMSASSTTLNSAADAAFTFADEGLKVVVVGAGNAAGSTDLVTTIALYVSATQVTLASACQKTGGVSGVAGYIGARWLTQDGTHGNEVANKRILDSGVVTPYLP